MVMVLILTCSNCRRTSAVRPGIERFKSPRVETWLEWGCVRCNTNHRWLIPKGRTVENTARESLKHSIAHPKARKRKSVYVRLRGVPEDERMRILFGELIWWWRNESALELEQAASAAQITSRQWMRVEAGKNLPHADNLQRIVHASRGTMDQAFLVIASAKKWRREFIRRIRQYRKRVEDNSQIQCVPANVELEPDVELALDAFRRVLPAEADENKFLFFALAIHQIYWTRSLGGTITVDDDRSEIVPAIMNIADILERCENKKAKYSVIYEMARGAGLLLRRPELADFVRYFLRVSFNSSAGEEEVERRLGPVWKELVAPEKLVLALFDLVDPEYQPRLIKSFRKLKA